MYRDCKMNVNVNSKKVILELLSSCNLNCSHCFYRASNKFHSPDFLSKEELFSMIDDFARNNASKLVLTGGEPTIHPSFVDISEYAISKIPKVSICTNGDILNDDLENKTIDLNFSTYTVSIDSHIDEIHDKFRGKGGALKKTLGFLKKLELMNRKISIHITIHPQNIDTVEDTIRFSKRFTSEIVIGSIYYNNLNMKSEIIKKHNSKIKKFYEKYKDDPEIILVGFTPFCASKTCLDQKNVFMVNRKGKHVSCYWKNNGGKEIKNKLINL